MCVCLLWVYYLSSLVYFNPLHSSLLLPSGVYDGSSSRIIVVDQDIPSFQVVYQLTGNAQNFYIDYTSGVVFDKQGKGCGVETWVTKAGRYGNYKVTLVCTGCHSNSGKMISYNTGATLDRESRQGYWLYGAVVAIDANGLRLLSCVSLGSGF